MINNRKKGLYSRKNSIPPILFEDVEPLDHHNKWSDTRHYCSHYLLRIFLALFFSLGSIYLYLVSFHRINTLQDMISVLSVLQMPLVNNRCRQFNTTHFLCLPNVFMIGASKCGTTTLTELLDNHDKIHFTKRRIHPTDKHREVHRFDRNTFGWAMRSIELLDEWASSPLVTDPDEAVVHYTPHYLYAPTVPFELRSFYPAPLWREAKFLVMLREPVSRAWSSYWFHKSHLMTEDGLDSGSVEEFEARVLNEARSRRSFEACMQGAGSAVNPPSLLSFADKLRENLGPGRERISSLLPSLSLLHSNGRSTSLPSASPSSQQTTNQPTSFPTLQPSLPSNCSDDSSEETSIPDRLALQAQKNSEQNPLWTDWEGTEPRLSRARHFSALRRCFSSLFRSPALGSKHLAKGLYADQLLRWIGGSEPVEGGAGGGVGDWGGAFPRESFLFILLEDWAADPRTQWERIMTFLDGEREEQKATHKGEDDSNQSSEPTSPSPSPSLQPPGSLLLSLKNYFTSSSSSPSLSPISIPIHLNPKGLREEKHRKHNIMRPRPSPQPEPSPPDSIPSIDIAKSTQVRRLSGDSHPSHPPRSLSHSLSTLKSLVLHWTRSLGPVLSAPHSDPQPGTFAAPFSTQPPILCPQTLPSPRKPFSFLDFNISDEELRNKRLEHPNSLTLLKTMPQALKEQLQAFYRPYNEVLDEILGRESGYATLK